MNSEVLVYRRRECNGKIHLIASFNSVEDLVSNCSSFDNFSYCDTDRTSAGLHSWDRDYTGGTWVDYYKTTHYCYVAYNSKNKIIGPDILTGLRRKYIRNRWKRYYYRYNSWSKRSNGHWYRHPKTTQERRWANAWDDEEFAPRIRTKRNARHLPNSWDDLPRGSKGKNWKNYRKHQWKEKGVAKATP